MLEEDLDAVLALAGDDILRFRSTRMLVLGGTGFVGTWLVASIVHANRRTRAGITVDVLTRDPSAFLRREPTLARAPGLELVTGDLHGSLDALPAYDAIVNAATPGPEDATDPGLLYRQIVDGQEVALAIARRSKSIPFLYTSSGAVYGPQPPALERLDESYAGSPDPTDPRFAYHRGKAASERMGIEAAGRGEVDFKLARLFAFVGPHLPLDRNFAAGNFIRDALAGGPIVVQGDGTTVRSYLYALDMTVWLWAVLARGATSRPFNIGSEHAVDIETLARTVGQATARSGAIRILGAKQAGNQAARYVPQNLRVRSELGVEETVSLAEGVERTIRWHRSRERPGA